MEIEFKTISNNEQRILVQGTTSLAHRVAAEFAKQGMPVVLCDHALENQESIEVDGVSIANVAATSGQSNEKLLDAAAAKIGEITSLVNIHVPSAGTTGGELLGYSQRLHELCELAADRMAKKHGIGCIVNHCMLPAMYAGTSLEDSLSMLRGAITGVTRSIARRFGKAGIRCVGVQTGMMEIPEAAQALCEKVKSIPMPMKRWGTADDLAKLVSFLALDASYITGQTIILDGGLTAGISGT